MKNNNDSKESIKAVPGPAIIISKANYQKMQENINAKQNQKRLENSKKYFKNINNETHLIYVNDATNKDKLKKIINNLSHIVEIKIENCEIYNEYSVIVLYNKDSDIIVCDSSAQANKIYDYLTDKLNQLKLQKNAESIPEL